MSATVTIDGVSCSYLEALRANADDASVVELLRDLFHRASPASPASGTVDLGAGGLSVVTVAIDRLYPGAYISAGWADDIDYGVVQNQTERGWWVFWHGSCTATVAQDGPDVTIHEDLEHARLEAYTRASAYYASKETLA